MSVLGSHLPLKECFRIQGTCHTPNTVVRTFFVNVSIKSQQAMKTAMTPMSFARIQPFVSLWTKTTLLRQANHSCQDLKTKYWVTGKDFMLWTVCSNGASVLLAAVWKKTLGLEATTVCEGMGALQPRFFRVGRSRLGILLN